MIRRVFIQNPGLLPPVGDSPPGGLSKLEGTAAAASILVSSRMGSSPGGAACTEEAIRRPSG
eukprot:170541-Pyramimonas_sp.AAC.1